MADVDLNHPEFRKAMELIPEWRDNPERVKEEARKMAEYAKRQLGEIPHISDHKALIAVRHAWLGEQAIAERQAKAEEAQKAREAATKRRKAEEAAERKREIATTSSDRRRLALALGDEE